MELTTTVMLICVAAFFVAGFIDAIAGGGGLITTPVLLLAGLPPHYALGTNKFSAMLGSMSALISFARRGLISTRIALKGFAFAFVGAATGSWLALQIDNDLLGKIMVFLLPIALLFSLFVGRGAKLECDVPEKGLGIKIGIISAIIGAYDGFFGPGTGSFFIIALHAVLRMGLIKASATAKVLNLASNMGGLATFATGGVVLFGLGIPCALGSILGNILGVRLAVRVGAGAVRTFLYVALSLLMVSLGYRFFFV